MTSSQSDVLDSLLAFFAHIFGINEIVICYQFGKITYRRFDRMLQSPSGQVEYFSLMTEAFSRNVSKLFSKLKLVTDIYAEAN